MRSTTGRHRSSVVVRAFTTPTSEAVTYERQLPLGEGGVVIVQVETSAEGKQHVTVSTNRSGKLLLHWGVEGGKGYKGGWRLPGDKCRPEGTLVYKQRALQTPFRTLNGNGVQVGAANFCQLLSFWCPDCGRCAAGARGGTNSWQAHAGSPAGWLAPTMHRA